MVMNAKDARCKWQREKEEELMSFVDEKVKNGVSVTAALKEYGKKNGISWLTARWKYYQVKKRPNGKVAVEPAYTRKSVSGDDFLGALTNLIETSKEWDQDIVPFINGLSKLAGLSREGLGLKEKIAELEASYNKLASEHTELSGKMGELKQKYDSLKEIIVEWLELSQVDKVSSLKEFADRLFREVNK
jgi:hypothetical protein